jgi:hypothetical protein
MKRFFLLLIFPFLGKAQFAPAAGQTGTSAVKKDSSIIVNWAKGCKVTRGWQDISNQALGKATVGDSSNAIGAADGLNVVSLGDGGYAVLTFQSPIKNGPGYDFCVFENSFDPGFLELAFVEVSSDGANFIRFPATSNQQTTLQISPFATNCDPTKLNNLAGKYIANYGTPFDLQELQGIAGLDINNITHVKIVDVIGSIQTQYATFDKNNNMVNDPWSTPFPSGGFDLDAVAVINQVPVSVIEQKKLENSISVFPTNAKEEITIINSSESFANIDMMDVTGKSVLQNTLLPNKNTLILTDLSAGVYFLKISSAESYFVKRIIKE